MLVHQVLIIQAEIKEVISSNGRTVYGYGLVPKEDLIYETNYIHHPNVDGDTLYGMSWSSFPRRAQVGSGFYMEHNVLGGSRTIACFYSSAYTNGEISYLKGRDL